MKKFIDRIEVDIEREGRTLTLSTVMAYDGELVEGGTARLAALAAGRIADDAASIRREPGSEAVKLVATREIASGDGKGETELLEDFLNSADWWMERLEELKIENGK